MEIRAEWSIGMVGNGVIAEGVWGCDGNYGKHGNLLTISLPFRDGVRPLPETNETERGELERGSFWPT